MWAGLHSLSQARPSAATCPASSPLAPPALHQAAAAAVGGLPHSPACHDLPSLVLQLGASKGTHHAVLRAVTSWVGVPSSGTRHKPLPLTLALPSSVPSDLLQRRDPVCCPRPQGWLIQGRPEEEPPAQPGGPHQAQPLRQDRQARAAAGRRPRLGPRREAGCRPQGRSQGEQEGEGRAGGGGEREREGDRAGMQAEQPVLGLAMYDGLMVLISVAAEGLGVSPLG